jgi:hypothetical protein
MPGAFRSMEQTGEELPYSWNADNLKRYYPWKSELQLDVIYSSFFIFASLYSKKPKIRITCP